MNKSLFFIFIFWPYLVYSTGQIPDLLVIKNDTLPLFSNPLEKYLSINHITEIPEFVGCQSTACWRGYKAIWLIQNDSLFLIKITSCHNDCGLVNKDANLKLLFNAKFVNNRVFAYWVNENLRSPKGKLVEYIHMGYASTYEKDLNIIVKNGLILRIKEIKNLYRDPHRLPRNNKILIVDSLMNTINKQINWTRVPVEDDIEWSEDFEIKFSKNGKLIRVKNIDWVWCGFKRSIKKSLKGFPKIEIFKIEGEKQSEIFKLELTFNYMGKKIFLDNRFFYGN